MASSNEVNAPSFFSTVETLNGLDRVRRYVQSKLGDLGFQLANNIDEPPSRPQKARWQPAVLILNADDMVIFGENR